jgi:hypothetical protein
MHLNYSSHLRKMGNVGRKPVAEMTIARQDTWAHTLSARKPFGDEKSRSNLKAGKPKLRHGACHGPRGGSRGRKHVISNKHVRPHSVTSDCSAFGSHVSCCNPRPDFMSCMSLRRAVTYWCRMQCSSTTDMGLKLARRCYILA